MFKISGGNRPRSHNSLSGNKTQGFVCPNRGNEKPSADKIAHSIQGNAPASSQD
jgi:hypothetical protein